MWRERLLRVVEVEEDVETEEGEDGADHKPADLEGGINEVAAHESDEECEHGEIVGVLGFLLFWQCKNKPKVAPAIYAGATFSS